MQEEEVVLRRQIWVLQRPDKLRLERPLRYIADLGGVTPEIAGYNIFYDMSLLEITPVLGGISVSISGTVACILWTNRV